MLCRLLSQNPGLRGAFTLETLNAPCLSWSQKRNKPCAHFSTAESISSIHVGRAHCVGASGSSSPRAMLCPWAQIPRALEAITGRYSSVHPGPMLRSYSESGTILDTFLLDDLIGRKGATTTIPLHFLKKKDGLLQTAASAEL